MNFEKVLLDVVIFLAEIAGLWVVYLAGYGSLKSRCSPWVCYWYAFLGAAFIALWAGTSIAGKEGEPDTTRIIERRHETEAKVFILCATFSFYGVLRDLKKRNEIGVTIQIRTLPTPFFRLTRPPFPLNIHFPFYASYHLSPGREQFGVLTAHRWNVQRPRI